MGLFYKLLGVDPIGPLSETAFDEGTVREALDWAELAAMSIRGFEKEELFQDMRSRFQQLDPGNADALIAGSLCELAEDRLRKGDAEGAIFLYQAVTECSPFRYVAYEYEMGKRFSRGIGVPEYRLGALFWLERAIERGNTDAEAELALLMRRYSYLEAWQQAITVLGQCACGPAEIRQPIEDRYWLFDDSMYDDKLLDRFRNWKSLAEKELNEALRDRKTLILQDDSFPLAFLPSAPAPYEGDVYEAARLSLFQIEQFEGLPDCPQAEEIAEVRVKYSMLLRLGRLFPAAYLREDGSAVRLDCTVLEIRCNTQEKARLCLKINTAMPATAPIPSNDLVPLDGALEPEKEAMFALLIVQAKRGDYVELLQSLLTKDRWSNSVDMIALNAGDYPLFISGFKIWESAWGSADYTAGEAVKLFKRAEQAALTRRAKMNNQELAEYQAQIRSLTKQLIERIKTGANE